MLYNTVLVISMCFNGTKQNRIEKTLLLFESKSAILLFALKMFKIHFRDCKAFHYNLGANLTRVTGEMLS